MPNTFVISVMIVAVVVGLALLENAIRSGI